MIPVNHAHVEVVRRLPPTGIAAQQMVWTTGLMTAKLVVSRVLLKKNVLNLTLKSVISEPILINATL
jgi:hypothetical protein